jgi:hypothetical protein
MLTPAQRGVENRQKAGFEQQRIPLELEKQLARGGQRQIEQPQQRSCRRRNDPDNQEERRDGPAPAKSGKPRIASREPHERWPVVVGGSTLPLVNLGEELSDRQDAVFADDPRDLNRQRHERDAIDDTK